MLKHSHQFAGACRAAIARKRGFRAIYQYLGGTLAVVALALAGPVSAQAQALPASAQRQIGALLSEKASRNPAQVKMDSHLVHAAQILRGQPVHPDFPVPPGELEAVRLDARNAVEVDIAADVTSGLLALIGDLGGTVVNSFAEYHSIRARLPLLAVEQVAARDEVRQIRVADPGYHASSPARGAAAPPALAPGRLFRSLGSAFQVITSGPDTSGDTAHQGPVARLNYQVDGTGVKIGVLSDGVNSRAAEQTAGRLPAVTVIAGQAGSGDEGTAMLEIVYTLAPGATLYFATADGGPSQLATNMQALANAGCKVIVDDTVYFNEGVFEDGPVAAEANALAAAGVFYFSSAGNSGNLAQSTSGTWQGDFADSGTTLPVLAGKETGSYTIHSFSVSATYDTLTTTSQIPVSLNGGNITGWYELKWSDPLGGSNNDYDYFLLDSAMANVIASSTNVQSGTQDPEENFPGSSAITSACNAGTCRIVVVKHASAAARTLYVDTERGRLTTATGGATFGHNAASGIFSIAATYVFAPFKGAFSATNNYGVEAYSSDGPRQMFFAGSSAITPNNFLIGTGGGAALNKPDFTAADCVTTGVSGFQEFCGTSAAAPHAAAIAALALEAQPNLTPAQLRAAMTASAIDIGAAGWDINSGAGIVMAPGTVNAACGYSASVPSPVSSAAGSVSLSISAGQNCPWSITGPPGWILSAAPGSGKGPATVTLTLAANSGSPRSATLSLNAGALATGASASFTQSNAQPLTILTSATLLPGFVNGSYSQDLSAAGGVAPYTWTKTAGALPAGLALVGAAITGTPTAAGTFPGITMQVKDSAGSSVSQTFSLTIIGVPSSGTGSLARVGVLAHFAAAGGWDTTVYIINNTAAAIPVRLKFVGNDGGSALRTDAGAALSVPLTVTQQSDSQTLAVTTLDRVVNPNTTLVVAGGLGMGGNWATGWVDVLAAAQVYGYAVFRYAPGGLTPGVPGFMTPWEGTVPLQSLFTASTITLPFDNSGGFTTGLAIGTLTGGAITANFYAADGTTLGTQQTLPTLPANGHTSFMTNPGPTGQNWSFTNGATGVVVFSGPSLIGLGLRASPYGTVTSVPAVLQ